MPVLLTLGLLGLFAFFTLAARGRRKDVLAELAKHVDGQAGSNDVRGTLEAYGHIGRLYVAFLERHRGEALSLKGLGTVTAAEVRDLVARKVIQGGMIPKVESCIAALQAGVGKIHIVGAEQLHALLLEIFTTAGIGTELRLGDAAAAKV